MHRVLAIIYHPVARAIPASVTTRVILAVLIKITRNQHLRFTHSCRGASIIIGTHGSVYTIPVNAQRLDQTTVCAFIRQPSSNCSKVSRSVGQWSLRVVGESTELSRRCAQANTRGSIVCHDISQRVCRGSEIKRSSATESVRFAREEVIF